MSYENKYPDWKDRVIAASNTGRSAAEAAAILGIKPATYKRYAEKYDCYVTNKSGKGKPKQKASIPLEDILAGLHPQYQSNKLRIRLLEEKYFDHICSKCSNTEWLGVPIPLELEHIDGVNNNHKLENLELLCPNCHAMTSTYRGRNKGI